MSDGAVHFRILGQAASKANSRRLVTSKKTGRLVPIKSKEALAFARAAAYQVPARDPLLLGPVSVTLTIFYASELPDLDESVVLDVLQGRIYKNDRQVREKHVFHRIDRDRPRVEGFVVPVQGEMLGEVA